MMQWHGVDLRWAYSDLLPNIYRQTLCKQNALDVLHDALVRFALAKNPDRAQRPHAYLQVIIRNILIDQHNHQRRLVPLITDESEEDYLSFVDQRFTPSAEYLADLQQRLKAMQQMIDSLPPRCREVFWLYRVEGLNQVQIAEQLGITSTMVHRHVARALVALAEADDLLY